MKNKKIKNKYSPSEFFKNIYSLIMTKITMPKARFIRRPLYIRGGEISYGVRWSYNGSYV